MTWDPAARDEPDLFLADLLGVPARRITKPRRRWPAAPAFPNPRPAPAALARPVEEDPSPRPAPLPQRTPLPTPAPPGPLCARDTAVTDTIALLATRQAPLPVSPCELKRLAGDAGALDDSKAVCAIVPAAPERVADRLLLFLHGNNHYVTVAPSGDVDPKVDPSGHSRIPRWLEVGKRPLAGKKPAVPFFYGFTTLAARQRALAPAASFAGQDVKDPLVLLPEDVEQVDGKYWSVPPRCQYGTASDGKPTGPGSTLLGSLVRECHDHLRCLAPPSGGRYLDPAPGAPDAAAWLRGLRRVYLCGHSGGGKPLVENAGADLVLPSAGGATPPVDLWIFDGTYGWGVDNYVNFCARWHKAGRLAHRADASRLVCVYRPANKDSNTETEADSLRRQLARVLGVSAGSLLQRHEGTSLSSPAMTGAVIPALSSSPVVFIRTDVGHEQIPTQFIPLLLRTAAS